MFNNFNSTIMKNLFLFLFLSNFATSFSQSQPQFHKDSVSIIYKIIDTSALKLDIYYPLDFNKKKIYPAIIFFFGW